MNFHDQRGEDKREKGEMKTEEVPEKKAKKEDKGEDVLAPNRKNKAILKNNKKRGERKGTWFAGA